MTDRNYLFSILKLSFANSKFIVMSSHKVKGQKVDLASFVGPSMGSLPTAPDPNRVDSSRDGRRGGDRGFGGDRDRGFGGRGGDREERGGRREHEPSAGDEDVNWRKAGNSSQGFGQSRGSGNGDSRDWTRGPSGSSGSSSGYKPLGLMSKGSGGAPPSATSKADSLAGWSEPVRNNRGNQGEDRGFGGDRRPRIGRGDARQEEEITDPRFANKFSTGFGSNAVKKEVAASSPFPTLSESVFRTSSSNQSVPQAQRPKLSASTTNKEDAKKAADDAKAAKAAAKAEADRAAAAEKEAKAAQAAAEKAAQEEEAAAVLANANAALTPSLKGAALLTSVAKMSPMPAGSALVAAILRRATTDEIAGGSANCWRKGEYGELLSATVMEKDATEQVAALFAVQAFCAEKKFPKIDVAGTQRRLIEVLFGALFKNQIVDADSIILWADSEDESVPGRMDAIVQTTSLVQALREAGMKEYGNDEEEEEDEEIDAPRQYIK